MGKIIEFPDREIIEDEALAWLIRLDGDKSLSHVEEKSLEEWLSRSPVHREALKSLNTFWSNSNVLGELAEPLNIVSLCRKYFLGYFWPLSGFRMGAVVATAFMVLALGVILGGQSITDSNGLYLTAVGQQKTISLADDSRIQLNTNSQIQVDYSEGFRNIRLLQGEVHFEVAKDESRPFRVYVGSGRVQAVGTAFNVYLKNDDVDVFVTEGRVDLASMLSVVQSPSAEGAGIDGGVQSPPLKEKLKAGSALVSRDEYAESDLNGLGMLGAGEAVMLKKTETTDQGGGALLEMVPSVIDDPKAKMARLAWRKGLLVFSGETLEKVIEEVGRYTSVNIEIVNHQLRDIEVGGQIRVSDTEAMFSALEANFGLKIERLSYNSVQIVAYDPVSL